MDKFQNEEFIVCLIHNSDEVETCVSLVDNFIILIIHKIAHFGFSGDDKLVDLD